MQKVWEVAEQDRLFETYADMSDEAFDALLEEADKAQLEGIVGALGRGIKKVATFGTAASRAGRAEKKLGKAQAKVDNKAKIATAKAKTAQLKKDNPSMVKRAAANKAFPGARPNKQSKDKLKSVLKAGKTMTGEKPAEIEINPKISDKTP